MEVHRSFNFSYFDEATKHSNGVFMSNEERLKEIEKYYNRMQSVSEWQDIGWLINRVKMLTEALEFIAINEDPDGYSQITRENIEIAKKALAGT
jgi:hypothetical protein